MIYYFLSVLMPFWYSRSVDCFYSWGIHRFKQLLGDDKNLDIIGLYLKTTLLTPLKINRTMFLNNQPLEKISR